MMCDGDGVHKMLGVFDTETKFLNLNMVFWIVLQI